MEEDIQNISIERYGENDIQSLSPDKQAVKDILKIVLYIVSGVLVLMSILLFIVMLRNAPKPLGEDLELLNKNLEIHTQTIKEVMQMVLLNFFLPIITGLVGFLVGKEIKTID